MKYRVTTLHDTRPTDLPPGSTVEEVPSVPLQLDTKEGGDTVTVAASAIAGNTAYIHAINRKSGRNAVVSLNEAETRKVYEALGELLGEASTPGGPSVVRDGGGSNWVRREDGRYTIDWNYGNSFTPDFSTAYKGYTLAEIADLDGPITVIK